MIDFDYLISASTTQAWLNYFTGLYEKDQDKREDLKQDISIKLWQSIPEKYDENRGTMFEFVYGFIALEAKKHVLDAHKYRQEYFDDNMLHYDQNSIDYSTIPYVEEEVPDDLIDEFRSQLTCYQCVIFDTICDMYDMPDNTYKTSGKFKSSLIDMKSRGYDLRKHLLTIKKRLFEFAKANKMLVNLSTADAGL